MKIMKAEEARNISIKVNSDIESSQYKIILRLIAASANKGEYAVWFNEEIKEDVRIKLIELGYKVGKTQFYRNESNTQIRW